MVHNENDVFTAASQLPLRSLSLSLSSSSSSAGIAAQLEKAIQEARVSIFRECVCV